ncbi:MAG: DUF2330 domain-containing protein [Myxococcota bacterium]
MLRIFTFASLLLAFAGFTPRAQACGGFFCNNSLPVNQAAERILFAQNADGTTTAVIQIQYEGPSENFAWMLPVQGNPEVGVSSDLVFTLLQQATNPSYTLNREFEGTCSAGFASTGGGFGCGGDADAASAGGFDAGALPPPMVEVVNSGSIGPFDFVTISVRRDAEDIATVATDWLIESGYDVSPLGRDRLVPYLEGGMNLLAFRLTKGADAGEIRPIRLSFGEGLPSIPLRPTAAAATPDMGILVWVLGQARAVPANYRSLELNETLINWFSPGTNYTDIVTEAANEAGGQGFVTEFAGSSAGFDDVVLPPFFEQQFERVRQEAEADFRGDSTLIQDATRIFQLPGTPGAFGLDASLGFESGQYWEGVEQVVLDEVPKPESVREELWRDAPLTYLDSLPFTIEGFDRSAFLDRLEAEVLEPVRATAALFRDSPTLTRLFTTMSPDEMTMDPVFDFNADLPNVDNAHTLTQVIECNSNVSQGAAPWRIVFDDGTVVRGLGSATWPLTPSEDLPAVARARRVGTTGEGEVILDNSATIAAAIERNNDALPPASGGGDSCSSRGGPIGSGLFTLGLGLLAIRRRRP